MASLFTNLPEPRSVSSRAPSLSDSLPRAGSDRYIGGRTTPFPSFPRAARMRNRLRRCMFTLREGPRVPKRRKLGAYFNGVEAQTAKLAAFFPAAAYTAVPRETERL